MVENVNEPRIVKSHEVKLDAEYAVWIAEVKHRYRSAQVKAAVKVNGEKLLFNWQLGRDLVQKKAEERWGAGVVEQVSLDLQKEFPGEKGFSTTNLWYMKKWYLYYTTDEATQKLEQVGREVYFSQNKKDKILHQVGGEIGDRKLHQPGGEFPLLFALVPWKHHVEIITKCETIEKALFYIGKTIEQSLSRDDNPTIGLLICSDMNKTEVQWSFKGISTPMGVATYNNIRIKDMLPTQEQLKERMELLQKELKHTKRLLNKK